MKFRVSLVFLCIAALLIIPATAVDHTVQFQNHCPTDVSVVIVGGQQSVVGGSTYGACQCLPDTTCTKTTSCSAVACGENNKNTCSQGTPLVDNGGFLLAAKTGTHTSTMEKSWQGTFWPRSGCTFDDKGNYQCDIDLQNCNAYYDGKPKLECGGHGITLATKGEINFDENGFDTYDVSAVDGFSIPMTIELVPGTYDASGIEPAIYACTKSGNGHDLFAEFWPTLSRDKLIMKNTAGNNVAIRSACAYASALNLDKNNQQMDPLDTLTNMTCCLGPWGSAQDYQKNGNMKCDPDNWPQDINTAKFFKSYFPTGYSYAYDDHKSTFTCKNKNPDTLTRYIVTFCPANEGERTNLPGSTDHVHVSDIGDPKPVTPQPTATPVPAQTPVTRYKPTSEGASTF